MAGSERSTDTWNRLQTHHLGFHPSAPESPPSVLTLVPPRRKPVCFGTNTSRLKGAAEAARVREEKIRQ